MTRQPPAQESTHTPSRPEGWPPLFVTGAAGFLGRAVVARPRDLAWPDPVGLLIRRAPVVGALLPGWQVVTGDLLDTGWQSAVPNGAVVLHLAASPGKASRRNFDRANIEGTAAVVAAAKAAGAAGIPAVSSVEAGYRDQRYAWYARSKARAEALVAESGLPWTIVRPTQVLGEGSPVAAALTRIANLPVPIVLGTGRVLVQPLNLIVEPKGGRTGRWIRCRYRESEAQRTHLAWALGRLRRALGRLGAIVPRSMTKVLGHGASIHYGGTLPMAVAGGPHTLTPEGRSRLFGNLVVADAAGFPFLPAKNHTFTLMANAIRIAEAVLP